jgi:hypothetical protein
MRKKHNLSEIHEDCLEEPTCNRCHPFNFYRNTIFCLCYLLLQQLSLCQALLKFCGRSTPGPCPCPRPYSKLLPLVTCAPVHRHWAPAGNPAAAKPVFPLWELPSSAVRARSGPAELWLCSLFVYTYTYLKELYTRHRRATAP